MAALRGSRSHSQQPWDEVCMLAETHSRWVCRGQRIGTTRRAERIKTGGCQGAPWFAALGNFPTRSSFCIASYESCVLRTSSACTASSGDLPDAPNWGKVVRLKLLWRGNPVVVQSLHTARSCAERNRKKGDFYVPYVRKEGEEGKSDVDVKKDQDQDRANIILTNSKAAPWHVNMRKRLPRLGNCNPRLQPSRFLSTSISALHRACVNMFRSVAAAEKAALDGDVVDWNTQRCLDFQDELDQQNSVRIGGQPQLRRLQC